MSNNDDDQVSEVMDHTVLSALTETFSPIDANEWKESNFLFKFMLIVKAPVIFVLKLTVPLVDYEARNHNWNKITNIINCIAAPLFMVFAVKGYYFQIKNM